VYLTPEHGAVFSIQPYAGADPGGGGGATDKHCHIAGADPGFQVRGGALKKNCAERREARKMLGYFV
jgi:hypothetical protein